MNAAAMRNPLVEIYRRLPWLRSFYRPLRKAGARIWLKRRVQKAQAAGLPLRIVIGSNRKYQQGWIPTELYTLNMLEDSDWQRYFQRDSIDLLLAEHVWEHLSRQQGRSAAQQCLLYLKPGGKLRVAVPDGYFPNPDYIEFVRPGGSGPSAWDHKELYTHESLAPLFSELGFTVELLEYFDREGQFHSRPWDPEEGLIARSARFHQGRRFGSMGYRSLILDATKPPSNA